MVDLLDVVRDGGGPDAKRPCVLGECELIGWSEGSVRLVHGLPHRRRSKAAAAVLLTFGAAENRRTGREEGVKKMCMYQTVVLEVSPLGAITPAPATPGLGSSSPLKSLTTRLDETLTDGRPEEAGAHAGAESRERCGRAQGGLAESGSEHGEGRTMELVSKRGPLGIAVDRDKRIDSGPW